MKSKEFIKLLSTLIREEVRTAVRLELNEIFSGQQTVNPRKTKPKRSNRAYSKNSMINDILAETAVDPMDDTGDWNMSQYKSMLDDNMGYSTPTANVIPTVDHNNRPVNLQNENVAAVADAMTRDYSELMKVMDKKKREKMNG